MALLLSGAVDASPVIAFVTPRAVQAGDVIKLTGSGFGPASATSEVVADYGHGFFYALEHAAWSNSSISVRIPDLGKSLKIRIHIVAGGQSSNAVSVTMKPEITAVLYAKSKIHRLKVGDKGEDVFRVENASAQCGRAGELFDHAEIVFNQKRFSEAQFVALPAKGCSRCGKIRVRWYNEPTGLLQYRLKVFKRRIEGVCRQRVRRR